MPCNRCRRLIQVQPRSGYDLQVLQVALRPAPVAGGKLDEARRALLERATEVRQHVDGPSGAAHEGGLDEVVAEDVAAEGLFARKLRQPGGGGKGGDADDGVVAPVVAVAAVPGGKPRSHHGAVGGTGELLHAGEQTHAPREQRHGLDDAGGGVGRHGAGKPGKGGGTHAAVGVEHHHVVVAPAPAGDEIGDIAGLPVAVVGAQAIVDRNAAAHPRAQTLGRRHLGRGDIVRARIGEHHDVEVGAQAVGGKIFRHGGEAVEDGVGILVVDGHDEDVAAERAGESAPGAGLRRAAASRQQPITAPAAAKAIQAKVTANSAANTTCSQVAPAGLTTAMISLVPKPVSATVRPKTKTLAHSVAASGRCARGSRSVLAASSDCAGMARPASGGISASHLASPGPRPCRARAIIVSIGRAMSATPACRRAPAPRAIRPGARPWDRAGSSGGCRRWPDWPGQRHPTPRRHWRPPSR